MTKVISFCLWGNNPKYTVGAVKNAKLALDVYPDWKCWFYVPSADQPGAVSSSIERELLSYPNTMIVHMDQPGDWRGMFWRFYPACEGDTEHDVEAWISRDCDSRLNAREAAAVDNWLKGPSLVHVMRDHPYHNTQILGGMWGAKRNAIRDMAQLIEDWNQEDRWQTDQEFLKAVIHPRCRSMIQEHDEFFAHKSFPTPREDYEFVGAIFDANDNPVEEHVEILRRAIG